MSKQKNEEVRWILKGEGDLLVDFKDNLPFYSRNSARILQYRDWFAATSSQTINAFTRTTVWIKDLKELDPGGGVKP